MLFKLKWIVSALLLKLFCKKLLMPSYFSLPVFVKGLNKVSIGKRVRIFPGARIEVHGKGSISIGDNVGIGQNFHVTSAGELTIGRNTTITANVCISNIVHPYLDISTPPSEQTIMVKDTTIGRSCFIGFGAVILPGSKLGNHCIVGANSVVSGAFPDYSVVAGNPAKLIKKYNFSTEAWERV
ncbi:MULTISPECIES: acyltransferase [Vibrio harveyi group]|uniref:acyltransferase n=1 Tax=Vibrio harveyi group TaxID=717610 RepID=UPI002852607F|nr:DapH/DapD/GlmU-related protein [Vibrio alginolyticus]